MPAPSPADIAAGVPAGANIVGRVKAPSGQGELLVDANGGVYDTGGQSFNGSYFSLSPEQRQGSRQFTGITTNDQGGYQLQSDKPGQNYDFGPSDYVKAHQANPLYSDPAFLQFSANAGLDYETAAADVARKQAALNNALALRMPQMEQQGKDAVDNVYGTYATRGLYGSGQQAQDEGKAQANNLASIASTQADTANQIADLHSGLVTKRLSGLQAATDRGYGVAGSQDLTNRFDTVDKKYPLASKTSPDNVGV